MPKSATPRPIPLSADCLVEINENDLKEDDRYVGEIDISMNASRYSWWGVICRFRRPGDSEPSFFKIRCWDSTNSSYQPEIPHGEMPSSHYLIKKVV